jgi:outer membrane protein TolC
MKKTLLILLLLFFSGMLFAREVISLDSCYNRARKNYPNLKQADLLNAISGLQKQNIQTRYLPEITLQGQAIYQSDVTGIDLNIPNITIPHAPKDQYKAYAEIRQAIWDGGISAAGSKLEDAILQNHLSELEVELYKLNEKVSQAFFSVLIAEKQLEVIVAQKTILEEKQAATESAVTHGTEGKTSVLMIQAELLNLVQHEIRLVAVKQASVQMLSLLTGKTISSDSKFISPESHANKDTFLSRPEMQLFESQRLQLDNQRELLDKSRNPKLFGFGQAGYGRPGLNMLSDRFDSFYLLGAGISWNAFDWNKTARQKQVLKLRQERIHVQKETFSRNINLLLAQQQEEINTLERILETDKHMVLLRIEVTQLTASRLENEYITTSEYIREVQAETIAKLNYELHKMQLNEAHEKYNLINGR